MLTISKLDDNTFIAKFGYSTGYFERMIKIRDSEFDSEDKCFYLPMSSYNDFKNEFNGEYVFKTERTEFPGEVIVNYNDRYKLRRKYDLPKLKLKPYDYQEYGTHFMLNKLEEKGYVLNCDSVGLGKTLGALNVLMFLIENKVVKKALILCKKSLRHQWKNEIEKFTFYDLDNVLIVNGTPKKKKEIYEQFLELERGILISNYDVVVSDMDTKMLDSIKPQILIIDEVHTIRGHTTKKNERISKIAGKIKYKILLTGTPMASKPDDLFGVMKLSDKKFFGLKKDFDNKFLNYEYGKFGKQLVGYRKLDELEQITHSMMIRRTEKEVELELPEILPPNRLISSMDNTQAKIYDFLESEKRQITATVNTYQENIKKLQAEGASGGATEEKIRKLKENIKIASDIIKGYQSFFQVTANDPRIFLLSDSEKVREKYGSLVKDSYQGSPKTEMLLDVVENIIEANQKVIIFSMYEKSVFLLEKEIKDKLKIETLIYTGSVDSESREKNIKLFMTNDEYNVIICTSAAQEGVNMQSANHVIHYDQPYLIADKIQRNGRARRVGSIYKNVFIYDLLTEDTVDIKKIEKLDNDEKLLDNVTGNSKSRSEAIKKNMK